MRVGDLMSATGVKFPGFEPGEFVWYIETRVELRRYGSTGRSICNTGVRRLALTSAVLEGVFGDVLGRHVGRVNSRLGLPALVRSPSGDVLFAREWPGWFGVVPLLNPTWALPDHMELVSYQELRNIDGL
jgi:hypothetical protein